MVGSVLFFLVPLLVHLLGDALKTDCLLSHSRPWTLQMRVFNRENNLDIQEDDAPVPRFRGQLVYR